MSRRTEGVQPSRRTHNGDKRELMAQARRAGWKGKTYGKAKRFERMLERIAVENARLTREAAERQTPGVAFTIPERTPKPRARKRWWMP